MKRPHLAIADGGAGGTPAPLPAAKATKEDAEKNWHRWTATDGFLPGSGWHHVAVTYTFGKGASVKGYLDGVEVISRPHLAEALSYRAGLASGRIAA